jgi:ribokinase
MTAPRLLVLGSVNVDLTAAVERAPERGETVAGGVLTRQAGGKGANQAVAAARLGADVVLAAAVGDDADGRGMTELLGRNGVDVSHVQRVDEATGTALIVVDASGENSIVVCDGANARLDAAAVGIGAHDAVLAQLEIDADVVDAVAARTDGLVVLNASPAQALPERLRARVDVFVVNETEYAAMPELERAPMTVVTLGARGAVLLRHGQEVARASSPAERVVNTVGAGDAFAAALTVGLLHGLADEEALARACAVGAAAVADPLSQPALRPLSAYAP